MDRLTATELARLVGCDDAQLELLAQLGILGPTAEGYADSEVDKVRLVLALNEAGISSATLAEALAEGGLSLDFAGRLMFEPAHLTGTVLDDQLSRHGLSPGLVRNLRGAAGWPDLAPGQVLRQDDLELLAIMASATSTGVSEEALARVLRVFGQSARRVAETMRDLFREQVEAGLLAAGLPQGDMLVHSAELRLRLQRVGFRTLFLLQRRALEELVFDNVVTRVQAVLAGAEGGELLGRVSKSVAFVDITGFTAMTEQRGDEHAAACAARLEALAHDAATRHGGHPVKSLGDGVLMLFPDPVSAVEGCLDLLDDAVRQSLPALAAGIATGPVVPRDGDIFGVTVNLAARIAAKAVGSQLLVCPETRAALAEGVRDAFRMQDPQAVVLKGFAAPVEVVAVGRRAAQR